MNRRIFLSALTGVSLLSLGSVCLALGAPAFDQSAFEAAQASGKSILVEVHAPWCPVCKAQTPILTRLKADPRFKDLVSFNIDFDSQKDLLRTFNVQKQSTLIVFKGKQEAGRSTGDSKPESIEALLAKSL